MSVKSTTNSNHNRKRRKTKQPNATSVLKESEVIYSSKTLDTSSKESYFADITHKNSSGVNNWAKFAKLSLKEKNCQPTKKAEIIKPQDQTANVLDNNESKKNYSYKPPNNIRPRSGITQNNLRQFNKKNPDHAVFTSNVTKAMKEKIVLSNDLQSDRPNFKTAQSLTKHIAMDCEMVGVEIGVNKSMLARISLVNSHGNCIYDKFVKPTEPVLDYRTRVSGVRPKDLENATDFKIVQKEVADMLKGRILVGHALKNDLKVLYLSHPKHSIRDTSRFKKFREGKTPALRKLAKKYLGVSIQEGEHSSIQDALAAMQLYKMFKKEWESSIYTKKHQAKKLSKNQPCQLAPSKSADM